MDNGNKSNLTPRNDPTEQRALSSGNDSVIYSGMPSHHNTGTSAGQFNIQFVLRAILQRWKIFILCLIVGLSSGILFAQLSEKIYRAEAILEMNVSRPRVINNAAVFDDLEATRDTDAIFNTRFEKFKSPAMEELATKAFFERYPETDQVNHPKGIDADSLAWLIRDDVKWSKDPDANIVRVAYESEIPRFAANLVNILSVCAGELMMAENRALSDEAVKWLVIQVEEQRESLETIEDQLSELREEVKIDNLEQRKTALQQAIMSVSGEREALISRLAERKTVYEFVSGLQDIDPKLVTLPSGFPKEDQLNELIRAWRVAYDVFEQIAGRYTEAHPEYRLAQENETRARQRLNQFIAISAKTVENEISLLERQMDQLNSRIDEMKREALLLEQDLSIGMQQVLQLERKRDAADNSYQTMLRRMEEARASADDNMAFTKVIRQADVPIKPVKPRKPVVLLFSIALTGFLGMAIILFLEFWQDTISSVDELRALNLKILGIIPSQKNIDLRGGLATIGLRDKFNPIVEMFAGINALFSSDRYQGCTKTLLLSGAMPGDGKTIASCNLAISSALNGMRTLLIDADLRRPQFMHIFAIGEEHPSLLEWLKEPESELSCEELVCRDVIDNLDVIFSRPLAEINPAELLGRGQLAELLAWARQRYDRIIIDSPPIGPVGDAHILSNLSDGIILVARIGATRRRLLKFGLNRLTQTDAPVLGCIVNDVPKTLAGMFGGAEGYEYSYGYTYHSHKID